jgi:ribulose 1,5-bisphosphate synthetase/thiazole synthase
LRVVVLWLAPKVVEEYSCSYELSAFARHEDQKLPGGTAAQGGKRLSGVVVLWLAPRVVEEHSCNYELSALAAPVRFTSTMAKRACSSFPAGAGEVVLGQHQA